MIRKNKVALRWAGEDCVSSRNHRHDVGILGSGPQNGTVRTIGSIGKFLILRTSHILEQIILSVDAVLCVAGCLASALASMH